MQFKIYESEISVVTQKKSENFRFSFSTKNNLTWGAECEKLISENRRGLTR